MTSTGRRPKKYSQAARVLRLLDILRSHHYGVTLCELAKSLAVTERQIRRDLDAITEAGHAVERPQLEGRAAARLVEAGRGAVRLSVRERYTLIAVRGVFDVLEDTPFREDVQSIFDKVVASLPHEHRDRIDTLGPRFTYLADGGTKRYRGREATMDALLTGVIHGNRVACTYTSAAGRRRRGELLPYAMVLYRHGLYIVGHLPRDAEKGVEPNGEARVFAAERFSRAKHLRGTSFELPADFCVRRYFNGAFGLFTGDGAHELVADFAAEVAHLIHARSWHPTQRLRKLDDGGVRLTLTVSEPTQLVQWLVGWGPWVRIIGPDTIRERVLTEHREAIANHEPGPRRPTSVPPPPID